MDSEEIEKNKIDMKYQATLSLALKCLGLFITSLFAVAGLEIFWTNIVVRDISIIVIIGFFIFSVFFFNLSNKKLDQLEELKN